ncbi:hypothetical protein [Vibrio alginolyticus]|uniref:hypothetical protein n=1 Tax=Vibrio TaxID=662 RepID=UPI0006CAA696|nr:hypothetical protein [Vibrio alginolyticus]KPM97640.1 hypothetical protein AOG25_14355 [Vibrio alginolyticus]CAH7206919.1 conserved hypothetical protein [Vibrio chagasii]CAH7374787.1 conserved hypothetical protein [Vibrio chagasii]
MKKKVLNPSVCCNQLNGVVTKTKTEISVQAIQINIDPVTHNLLAENLTDSAIDGHFSLEKCQKEVIKSFAHELRNRNSELTEASSDHGQDFNFSVSSFLVSISFNTAYALASALTGTNDNLKPDNPLANPPEELQNLGAAIAAFVNHPSSRLEPNKFLYTKK